MPYSSASILNRSSAPPDVSLRSVLPRRRKSQISQETIRETRLWGKTRLARSVLRYPSEKSRSQRPDRYPLSSPVLVTRFGYLGSVYVMAKQIALWVVTGASRILIALVASPLVPEAVRLLCSFAPASVGPARSTSCNDVGGVRAAPLGLANEQCD